MPRTELPCNSFQQSAKTFQTKSNQVKHYLADTLFVDLKRLKMRMMGIAADKYRVAHQIRIVIRVEIIMKMD